MDTNFNDDNLSTIYLKNIENYIVISEEMYKSIIKGIECNYLLILFSMSCLMGIICSLKKPKNEYMLIQNTAPVPGEIIDKV